MREIQVGLDSYLTQPHHILGIVLSQILSLILPKNV